jgi:hypothetical protein
MISTPPDNTVSVAYIHCNPEYPGAEETVLRAES